MKRQRGTTLAVGLVLLTLVALLGLSGADSARVERQLAQNLLFRENAASAASTGLEIAIRHIVTASDPAAVPASLAAVFGAQGDRYETEIRFAGYELELPQEPGARLAGAHFDIVSRGYSARHAFDAQRAGVMWVVPAPAGAAVTALVCAPDSAERCVQRGDLERMSWQRLARE